LNIKFFEYDNVTKLTKIIKYPNVIYKNGKRWTLAIHSTILDRKSSFHMVIGKLRYMTSRR